MGCMYMLNITVKLQMSCFDANMRFHCDIEDTGGVCIM